MLVSAFDDVTFDWHQMVMIYNRKIEYIYIVLFVTVTKMLLVHN